ncbi:MAG: hypothetical protein B9S32_00680 [Verrucomicrobia bacterium Tous-C9LFEB]|nr:MAG: hypothetical protein B9S32_00680 [Verrucomicrobia bacterium Tous-C9LFEB]
MSIEETEPKESGGCLVRGCLFFSVVLFVFVGFCGWGAYSTYKNLYALTSDAPVAIPVYEGTAGPAVQTRLNAFAEALEAKKSATLRLDVDDMNALVLFDPAFGLLKNRVYFGVEKDCLTAQMSVPLDQMRGLQGRWFNGKITFLPKMENGHLSLIPILIQAGDREAPMGVIKALQAFPWSNIFIPNPKTEELFSGIKAIRVEKNELVIEAN